MALADRIAAPLGEWHEAFQVARKNRNSSARPSACAPRFEQRFLAHMGKPVGVLVRNADELAAVRVGNPFLAAADSCSKQLFDHLVSNGEHTSWHGNAERPHGLEVERYCCAPKVYFEFGRDRLRERQPHADAPAIQRA